MNQKQTDSSQDVKTELKIRSGKPPGADTTGEENDIASDDAKTSVDEMMQGKNLEKKDREGHASDTDEVKR